MSAIKSRELAGARSRRGKKKGTSKRFKVSEGFNLILLV